MCAYPEGMYRNPHSPSDGGEEELPERGGALTRETSLLASSPLPRQASEKTATCQQEQGLRQGPQQAGTLILDVQLPELGDINVCGVSSESITFCCSSLS